MKKLLLSVLLTMVVPLPAFASPAIEKALSSATMRAGYCVDRIDQVEEIGGRYFVSYIAVGSYDPSSGCAGNASWSQLAELSERNNRYIVNKLNILEENQNFAYIDNVRISNDGIATLQTRAYGRSDVQHNPKDKRIVKIRLIDGTVLSDNLVGRVQDSDTFDEEY